MKKLIFCFIGMISLFLSSCNSVKPDYEFVPQEKDKLTKAEIQTLTYHAKRFVGQSKKVKLTKEQRDHIMKTEPKVKLKYLGHKYGKLEFSWKIGPKTVLCLTSNGYLAEKKQNWTLQINTSTESHPVPPGFLKEDMSIMALPPK